MENSRVSSHRLSKQLAFSAMAIALSTAASMVTLFKMPMGGSVTPFSMLFITLIGAWFGLGGGVACGIGYGLLQFVLDPYMLSVPQVVCDYFLAFGALGLSGLFAKRPSGLIPGYLVGIFGRFVFNVLSGVLFFASYAADAGFDNAWVYSAVYNGLYIGAEGALTIALLCLPPVRNALEKIRRMAAE